MLFCMREATETLLTKDATATVRAYPPRLAVPSAFTVRFRTAKTPLTTSYAAATRDTLTGVVALDAVRGAREISVILEADVVAGVQYLVETADGHTFVVEAATSIEADDDAVTVYLRTPLPCDVLEDSTFKGFSASVSLSTTDTSEIGRGIVEWQATYADGKVDRWPQDVRVVPRVPAPGVTAVEVVALSPYAARLQPPDDPAWDLTIYAVWSGTIAPVLYGKGLAPERIVSWALLLPWFKAAAESHLADMFEQDQAVVDRKTRQLRSAEQLAIAAQRFWYDAGDDLGEPAEVENREGSFTWAGR